MFSRTYTHYNLNVNAAIKEKIGTGPLHFLETVSEIQASGPKVTSSSFVFFIKRENPIDNFSSHTHFLFAFLTLKKEV